MFETPVLYIIYNRPDLVEQTFSQIASIKPKNLYIAADGPKVNNNEDAQACSSTRENVLSEINWDCNVQTLFKDENLGCKVAVSSAIDWFFDNVEYGIILEDDIVVDKSFFPFCEKLLKMYKNDERVYMISGFNLMGETNSCEDPYFFSKYGSIWGWATWERAWAKYDVDIKKWNNSEIKKQIKSKSFNKQEFDSRSELYDKLYDNEIDTWDYQWSFCRILENGLSIIPQKNMVANIGFNINATHTSKKPEWVKNVIYENAIPNKENETSGENENYNGFHRLVALNKRDSAFFKKVMRKIISFVLRLYKKEDDLVSYSYKPFKDRDIEVLRKVEFVGGYLPVFKVGTGTYFNNLKVFCWDSRISLKIGKYCSVGDNVNIIAGGEHDKHFVSTYPFHKLLGDDVTGKRFKGDIEIGNDVWIGNNVTILSGVKLGNGAIVGAGSVVVKDIAPYEIVGGNPAQHIRFRFNEEIISSLQTIQWWDWNSSEISERYKEFVDIDKFVNTYI